MKRGWIVGGWLVSLLAAALPVIWYLAGRVAANPLGKYVDEDGNWTWLLYQDFFKGWLAIAVPVSLLALLCMVANRRD